MSRKVVIYKQLMNEHPCVKEWLENRPPATQAGYGLFLSKFCEFTNITPEQFQNMERKEARDIAWNYIRTFINSLSTMSVVMAALKSFYRNRDGDTLPFDSSRGGKHYFNNHRRKRLATEHIPTPTEVSTLQRAMSNSSLSRITNCLLSQMFLIIIQAQCEPKNR